MNNDTNKLGITSSDNNPLDQYMFEQNLREILELDSTSPEYEGFFSRLWHTFLNQFKKFINAWSHDVEMWQAYLDNDWLKFCFKYLKTIENNPPSNEHFSGTVVVRASAMEAKQYLSCLKSVASLIKNTEKVLLSNDKNAITSEISNVIRYLESNKCKINPNKPSESKAATRMSYGSLGRMGTAGYGGDFNMWAGRLKGVLNEYQDIYKVLIDTSSFAKAMDKVEHELQSKLQRAEKASDRERDLLNDQIANVRTRTIAMRAIQKAAIDFFNTTLMTVAILPIHKVGLSVGMKEDLGSWILATNDD